jgi:hypothetical protein
METSANLLYAVNFYRKHYRKHGYSIKTRLRNNRHHTTALFMKKDLIKGKRQTQ